MFCLHESITATKSEGRTMTLYEVGRLVMRTAGRDAGRKAVVVEVLDNNYVLIDGNTRRKKVNIQHLEPLPKVLEIKKGATHEEVAKEFEKLGLAVWDKKPKESSERPRKQREAKQKKVEEKKKIKKVKETEKKPKKEGKEEKVKKGEKETVEELVEENVAEEAGSDKEGTGEGTEEGKAGEWEIKGRRNEGLRQKKMGLEKRKIYENRKERRMWEKEKKG